MLQTIFSALFHVEGDGGGPVGLLAPIRQEIGDTEMVPPPPLRWGDETLPNWAYENQVLSRVPQELLWADCWCCGPALRWAHKAFAATVALWVSVPLLAFVTAQCSPDGEPRVWNLVYAPIFFGYMYLLWLEGRVRRYTLIPHAVCNGTGFKLPGKSLKFRSWLALSTMMSVALHADVVTSGMVLAKMLAMNWQCSFSRYSEDAMSLWQLTMQQSLFGRALGVLPSLSVFFSIGWLMMGMQRLYALAMTVPRRVFKEFTNIETKFHYRLRESVDGAFQYQTLANPRTDVGDTVMVLNETCRMATVTF